MIDEGFALYTTRTPTVTRDCTYSVAHDEDVQQWPDDALESGNICTRGCMGARKLQEGKITAKGRDDARQQASSRSNRCNMAGCFCAGDSAHIVPPTERQA